MLEKLVITLKGKQYTTKEVVVGRVLDVWRLRTAISGGSYGLIYRVGMDAADEVLNIVNIEAFLTVFCPEVIEDLKPTSIREMGISDFNELKEVYLKEIEPWFEKVERLLKTNKSE